MCLISAPQVMRVLFVFSLLCFVCISADATSPLLKVPPKLIAGQKIKPFPGSQTPCTWDKTIPFLAPEKAGLELTTTGDIKGDVLVVGLDCGTGKVREITPAEKNTISTSFELGLSLWMTQRAIVCGSGVVLNPGSVKLSFNESLNITASDKSVLFVVDGASVLIGPTGEGMGHTYVDKDKDVATAKTFEKFRGTGKLPAFTMVMADPDLAAQSTHSAYEVSSNGGETLGTISGTDVWKQTAAHEFGHAMGLVDTYLALPDPKDPKAPKIISTKEYPIGLMNSARYLGHVPRREYIVEIMSRVFECRLDITTTLTKNTVISRGPNSWDFLGTISSKYSGVLTSQWAYFNGIWNTNNSCTVPNRMGEIKIENIAANTYQMCTAKLSLNNADEIDFNLGLVKEDDFLWQKFESFPSPPVQNFRVANGDCTDPVNATNKNTSRPREFIKPRFRLGSNGLESWIQDVTLENILGAVEANDPKPDESPTCTASMSWTGKLTESKPVLGSPIEVTGILYRNFVKIGQYTIKVDMKLAAK